MLSLNKPRAAVVAGACLFLGFGLVIVSSGQVATTASRPATTRSATTRAARTRPATTSRPATATAATAPKVAAPVSLSQLTRAAQALFDAANASDWTAAVKESTAFTDAMKKVKADLPKPDAEQTRRLTQITSDVTAFDAAIKARIRQPAIMNANRIIRVSGVLADTFINQVPQSIWQMEYLAREMQVWSAVPADLVKLKALPARIDAEWAKVSKEVTSKGGDTLVKQFTDEAAKVKSAATADDFAKLTKPLLDTLDKIETAYRK